jgi:hypothetical protein
LQLKEFQFVAFIEEHIDAVRCVVQESFAEFSKGKLKDF